MIAADAQLCQFRPMQSTKAPVVSFWAIQHEQDFSKIPSRAARSQTIDPFSLGLNQLVCKSVTVAAPPPGCCESQMRMCVHSGGCCVTVRVKAGTEEEEGVEGTSRTGFRV